MNVCKDQNFQELLADSPEWSFVSVPPERELLHEWLMVGLIGTCLLPPEELETWLSSRGMNTELSWWHDPAKHIKYHESLSDSMPKQSCKLSIGKWSLHVHVSYVCWWSQQPSLLIPLKWPHSCIINKSLKFVSVLWYSTLMGTSKASAFQNPTVEQLN